MPGFFVVVPIYMMSEKAADTVTADDSSNQRDRAARAATSTFSEPSALTW